MIFQSVLGRACRRDLVRNDYAHWEANPAWEHSSESLYIRLCTGFAIRGFQKGQSLSTNSVYLFPCDQGKQRALGPAGWSAVFLWKHKPMWLKDPALV